MVIGYAVTAATCNTTQLGNAEQKLTRRGGAVMPLALTKRETDVGAEAESLATNLVRFCAVHPSQE
jgi:hypothetical protein